MSNATTIDPHKLKLAGRNEKRLGLTSDGPTRQVRSMPPLDTTSVEKQRKRRYYRRRALVRLFEESAWASAGLLTGYLFVAFVAIALLGLGMCLGWWVRGG